MTDPTNDIIELDPPTEVQARRGPRNKWDSRLEVARARQGRWMMVTQPMSKATAAQVASDLRRSHVRDLKSLRISAVREGELWETAFGPHPTEPVEGEFHLWIKWMGPINEFAW